MGRRVLRRHIWGYSICICPIKGTPVLNELKSNGNMLPSPGILHIEKNLDFFLLFFSSNLEKRERIFIKNSRENHYWFNVTISSF